MVGNKAQKAVAAALTGVLAFGGVAPAFAGVWTGDAHESWYRVDGSHEVGYQLGTFKTNDDGDIDDENSTKSAVSGSELEKGENRYDTAFDALSYNVKRGEYEGTEYLVLASGTSYADSLVAAGVAGMLAEDQTPADADKKIDVPVMITPSDSLCTQARRAIKFFADQYVDADDTENTYEDFTVYLVGGTAALSEGVEDAIEEIKRDDKSVTVERIEGDDRMATSLKAAQEVDDDGWLDDDLATSQNVVFVAGGWAPADALSVSSVAYTAGKPILLTGSDGKLTDDQVAYLQKLDKKVSINVIGGPAAPTKAQLVEQGFTRMNITETSGSTRYETSAAVIEWIDRVFDFDAQTPIAVASGADAHMADALIGGAFVGANGGMIALVDGVNEVTALREAYALVKDAEWMDADNDDIAAAPISGAYVMGGEAAIDSTFAKKLNDKFPVQWNE